MDPADVDLEALVERAIREGRGLDELLSLALYGRFDPEAPAWTREEHGPARELWKRAVWLYEEKVGRVPSTDPSSELVGTPTGDYLSWTWEAILRVVAEPVRWWVLGDVSWERLARLMDVSQTQAQYRFHRVGWRFRGPPGDRWVVSAPCQGCGIPRSPFLLGSPGLCRMCRGGSTEASQGP